MWRQKKTWEGPNHPWKKDRLEFEKELMRYYGLKNKKELWKAATIARKIRKYVRYLNAKRAAGFDISEEEKRFKQKLVKYGLLNPDDELTMALNITVKEILERRLQTIVWRKGLAKTSKQARQLIVHKHIVVGDRVITSPGYLVKKEEEDLVKYHPYSPLASPEHPLRKFIEGKIENITQEEQSEQAEVVSEQ
ncbi:MAG TPA: 30S ribosomal protein S4 [Candidatus Nanopusillus sp.]|nr:30S ribosomal protein S4 [Candidatus Nanopusillus sp.]